MKALEGASPYCLRPTYAWCRTWRTRPESVACHGVERFVKLLIPVRPGSTTLVQVLLSRFDHADEMVGEPKVPVRQLHFWHVATHTVRCRDWTYLCCRRCLGQRLAGGSWMPGVAGETFRIVVGRDRFHVHVWIVASHAADTGIGTIEAFAVSQPVRSEADIHLTEPQMGDYRRPGAVALAAEVREVLGRHGTQVRRNGTELGLHGVRHMRGGTRVAMLAGDARLERGEVEFAIDHGAGRVATETAFHILLPQFAAQCFEQVVRGKHIVAQGHGEPIDLRKIAHQALVKFSIHGEEPRLRACAKAPLHGYRERMRAIAHAVDALLAGGDHRIAVPAAAKGQPGVGLQYGVRARHLHRLCHERSGLAGCFAAVARCATRRAF